jgi:hypothetical protein
MTAAAGNKNSFTRLIAVVLTGILAGLSGMVLALILHAIQHLAFGYSPGQIVSAESFLQGVTDSPGLVASRQSWRGSHRRIRLVAPWTLWAEAGLNSVSGG